MIEFPPLPAWDSLHPLVIHFPIALLLIAPLFVIIGGVLRPSRGRPYLIAALMLMALGTAFTYVATSTGKAAGELAERSPAVNAILEHHQELAETTEAVFLVLTLLLAGILVAPRLIHRSIVPAVTRSLLIVFLLAYVAGSVMLTNTAHNGGRLVHELGVRALMTPEPLPVDDREAHLSKHSTLAAARK